MWCCSEMLGTTSTPKFLLHVDIVFFLVRLQSFLGLLLLYTIFMTLHLVRLIFINHVSEACLNLLES